jgi:transposase, IS6 family
MCCNLGGVGWQVETIVKHATRPRMFKWRQTAPELILCAVRWYLRYSLSLRDVEELLAEPGLSADHTTIWRSVQRYGAELVQRLRRHLKPTNNPGVSMRRIFA